MEILVRMAQATFGYSRARIDGGAMGRHHEPLRGRAARRTPLQARGVSHRRKSAATYYPEANVLVPVRDVAKESNQPAHKCVRITLRPIWNDRS
ncbi:Putative formate dehydrogenase oxidoreductase protein [Labilithrix luteola]|uniref:Putative formate dehydrogenase oxidoreductase protein n=1 Tax=Labilithrix luteola TaxID=1391654 RepID=A0A0K1PJC3_9BACT|nr:Putative formate dehydrogenase oxidoreductase protein [Labilithrix luteola]